MHGSGTSLILLIGDHIHIIVLDVTVSKHALYGSGNKSCVGLSLDPGCVCVYRSLQAQPTAFSDEPVTLYQTKRCQKDISVCP